MATVMSVPFSVADFQEKLACVREHFKQFAEQLGSSSVELMGVYQDVLFEQFGSKHVGVLLGGLLGKTGKKMTI
jgi:hypothetical protein